jgi:hypothetical protein
MRKARCCQTHLRKGGSKKAAAFIVLCSLLVAVLHPVQGAALQTLDMPLILNIRGDVWAWSGAGLQQRTNWGYNKAPILSPSGNQIAYKATASIAVDAIKQSGGMGGGDLPANIWLLDVTTNNALRVVDQPADASLLVPNVPDKYVLRSDPTWSPDGRALAWTELVQGERPEGLLQLLVYDPTQKAARAIVPELPAQYGVPAAVEVVWGEPGLAVRSTVAATDAKGFATGEDSILIFDPAGKLLSSVKMGLLSEFGWIKDRGQDYIAALTNGPVDKPGDAQWVLIDPRTGRITIMPGVPELYSPLAPGGLSLVPTIAGVSPEWQVTDPGKPMAKLGVVDDVYVFTSALAISPDGRQIAYVKDGAAYIYSGGQSTKVAPSDVSAVTWGPTAWRVRRGI